MRIRWRIGFVVITLLILVNTCLASAQQSEQYSLAEVRDKHRALLMVFRLGVLDASNSEKTIIDQVLNADPQPRGRNQWAYGQIARKLNSYIRKYGSLSPARDLSDADYVIYFNIIEYRRILNTLYPFGELFVIVKGSPETQRPPRVVWKAKKILWAADAIGDLIKELKVLRGES